jgi:hypothetical protein
MQLVPRIAAACALACHSEVSRCSKYIDVQDDGSPNGLLLRLPLAANSVPASLVPIHHSAHGPLSHRHHSASTELSGALQPRRSPFSVGPAEVSHPRTFQLVSPPHTERPAGAQTARGAARAGSWTHRSAVTTVAELRQARSTSATPRPGVQFAHESAVRRPPRSACLSRAVPDKPSRRTCSAFWGSPA